MDKYHILIAEDDPVLRDLYLRKFSSDHYRIRTATNGEETLKMLEQESPDMLLLDINMPIVDGFGVLEHFPRDKRNFRVIILTNFDDQTNRERGEKYGVDDYFVKKDMTIKSLGEMVQRMMKEKVQKK